MDLRGLQQRIMAFISPSAKAYDRAYRMYENYARKIELELLGPTPDQARAARNAPELQEVKHLYEDALAICRQQGDWYNAGVVIYQMGLLYRLWGMPEKGIPCFEKSLTLCEEQLPHHPSARLTISLCHFYLGQARICTGNPDKAKYHLETAKALDEVLDDYRRLPAIRVMLGETTTKDD